jgi:hypothetical protein
MKRLGSFASQPTLEIAMKITLNSNGYCHPPRMLRVYRPTSSALGTALLVALTAQAAACSRGATPESTCRELEHEKLVTDCTAGSTLHTESLPGTQWHFKLANATVDNDGVIIQFNDAAEADAAYAKVVANDAQLHSLQTGFNEIQGKPNEEGPMGVVLPWRFAVDKPWTLIMMPSVSGDGAPVVRALKSIYLKDGASMNNLFYSGTNPMALPVSSTNAVSSASVNTVSAVQASASPSAGTAQIGDSDQFQDSDADGAPMYSFPRAEARQWLESEAKRTPADAYYDTTWYGFDSSAYLAFFEKACKEDRNPALQPKDEFDANRSRASIRAAREACMKRLSDDAGAPPTLARLSLPIAGQKDITWDPDNGTFDLFVHADEGILHQSERADQSQLWLADTATDPLCGGPGALAITLPAKGTFEIGPRGSIFSVLVPDPVQAKAAKSRLIAARALRVELLVRVGGYGGTGSSCGRGAPGNFVKLEEHGYKARLLAVRLTDGKERLTNWTKADQAAATLVR